MLKGRNFSHCSCAYGCPCVFSGSPTHGSCDALIGLAIDEGYHGSTRLDGLRFGCAFRWPGPMHEGRGEGVPVIDERATPAQREALLRILSGQDSEPGATFFHVYASMLEKLHEPVFARIDLDIDVEARKARFVVPGVLEAHGEPIRSPVTQQEQRVRIEIPDGFEFTSAEAGRGWSQTRGPIALQLSDSHAHFANLHITGAGVVR
jgi:hypothetical protein